MDIIKKWIKKLDDNLVKKSNSCSCCSGDCAPKETKKEKKSK